MIELAEAFTPSFYLAFFPMGSLGAKFPRASNHFFLHGTYPAG